MHLKGVNYMAESRLNCRNDLVGTGKVISIINGVVKKWFHLVGPPFPAFKARFSAGWHFSRVLIGSLLIGGCG